MEGRDVFHDQALLEVGRDLVKETARLADANEAIVKLATEQQQETEELRPGPPFCPHCGTLNPSVRSAGGGGPMAEFILAGQCDNCGKIFFGIPAGWHVTKDQQEALEMTTQTKGGDPQ